MLLKRVWWTPHLRLMTGVDHAQIAKEALSTIAAQQIEPAEFKFGMVNSPLRVAGVIDVQRDPLHAAQMLMAKDHKESVHEPTDLGRMMPTALELLSKISSIEGRVKVSFMPPHTCVEYHRHLDHTYVVHVPLITDPHVKMRVRMPSGRVFEQHYELGSVYLFNSHHEHAVVNDSDVPRVHLWCNFPQIKGDQFNSLNHLIAKALAL